MLPNLNDIMSKENTEITGPAWICQCSFVSIAERCLVFVAFLGSLISSKMHFRTHGNQMEHPPVEGEGVILICLVVESSISNEPLAQTDQEIHYVIRLI